MMIPNRRENDGPLSLDPEAAWAGVWHLWTVLLPRRSITGRLVWGMVWRRNRGGRWVYKKFIEYADRYSN